MKPYISFLAFFFFVIQVNSQAYKVEITTEPYDSLTQFESLSDNGSELYFNQNEFEMPWEFPFFGKLYNKIVIDERNLIYVVEHEEDGPYEMNLFDNGWARYYQDLNSDYRYGQSSPDNVCFEWRNVGSWTGISDKPGERGYATFKSCIWKNGDIELHFDKLVFDETLFDSIFTLPGLQGVVSSIALTNPDSRENGVILSYDPNNPKIVYKWDFFDTENPPYMKILPKDQLKIKFVYNLPSSSLESVVDHFKIPSPTTSFINIPSDIIFSEFKIHSITGELVHSGPFTNQIATENLPAGIYILMLNNGSTSNKYKFVKI